MFIYRFNQLIRSRLLWGFFAIIISFAFVAVGSCFRMPPGSIVGKINGKKISRETYNGVVDAIRKTTGRNPDNALSTRALDRKAWEQLAATQIAADNGLTANAREVREEILGQNYFQGPNGFDLGRYRAILREQGFSEATYETLVAQQMLMMKVDSVMRSALWISPMELNDELAAMTDVFTVQTTTLSNRFANTEMPLTDEDYKAFYEANQESFKLPDRVSVRYITIPLSNYFARVTVPEDSAQDYYDAHLDRYPSSDTNSVTGVKTFEEVKDEILLELQLEEARDCAETNVMFTVFGRRAKAAAEITLEALAAQEEVEVKNSPLFAQNETLFWTTDSRAFANTAFDLDPESFETRFGVMKGRDEISVMELLQKSPAHVPSFEDVAEDVKQRKQESARIDAFESYVKEIRADITKLMGEGKAFEEAAMATAQNVSTSLTYTVSEMQMKPFENSYPIAYGAMALKKGDLSEAVSVSATQSLLIYVLDREQGNALNAEMMRAQIRSNMTRRRGGALFSDWLTWNLDQQRFEPDQKFADDDITDSDADDTDNL